MADTILIETPVATVLEVGGPQGPQGVAGATGATGSAGAAGQGVPTGGTTGQVLRKASGTNYDTEWATAGSGSGSVTSVALAGTGLSISGSPVTASGTITANVSYGTTASTAAEGNDTRIANIRSSSIDTRTNIGAGGNINTSGGEDGAGGLINTSNGGGEINTSGGDDGNGGSINTNNRGGSIDTRGAAIGLGGSINTSAGEGGVGGSIETYNGGGSINTRGTGNIGLGVTGTRTTVTGTATADRAISLPNASGTIALTSTFAAPPAIGSTTPAAGAFTTLAGNNGTLTASAPVLELAQTWNNAAVAFTALRLDITNTASLSAGSGACRFLDFRIGGTSQIRFERNFSVPVLYFGSTDTGVGAASTTLNFYANGGAVMSLASGGSGPVVRSDGAFSWASSTNITSSTDLSLARDAANTLAQRNSTNPQTFRLYNTYTDASNYERVTAGLRDKCRAPTPFNRGCSCPARIATWCSRGGR
jgi:hypothetical protein